MDIILVERLNRKDVKRKNQNKPDAYKNAFEKIK